MTGNCSFHFRLKNKMSNEIDYFPRGATIDAKIEKPRINRIDRDDLFIGTSSKRKRSKHDSQKLKSEQKKKKKKSLDGEDHHEILYRRLHKQVRSFLFSLLIKISFIHRISRMVFFSVVVLKKSLPMNYVLVFHIKILVIFH